MDTQLPEALGMFHKRFQTLFADFTLKEYGVSADGAFLMNVLAPNGEILAVLGYDPGQSKPFGFLDASHSISFAKPSYDYADPEELLHRLKKLAAACTMC